MAELGSSAGPDDEQPWVVAPARRSESNITTTAARQAASSTKTAATASVFRRVVQPMVDEEQHLLGMIDEEEALPLRPMTQINIHTLPGGAITLFDSSDGGGTHSELRQQYSIRGDYNTEGEEEEGIVNETGDLVELVDDGTPHHDGSIHRTISPLAFKES